MSDSSSSKSPFSLKLLITSLELIIQLQYAIATKQVKTTNDNCGYFEEKNSGHTRSIQW